MTKQTNVAAALIFCIGFVFLTLQGHDDLSWWGDGGPTTVTPRSCNDSDSTITTTKNTTTRAELSTLAQQVFFSNEQYNRYTSLATMRAAKVPMKLNHAHVNDRFWLCAAPKTGCTGWFFFILYVNDGIVVPKNVSQSNPGIIHGKYAENRKSWTVQFTKRNQKDIVERFSNFPHYVVGRNPYVRFVSSWKDWMHRTGRSNVTLAQFAEIYAKRQEFTVIDHVDSVSKYCGVGNPLKYTALRVEEQALWFDGFLEKYNLTQAMKHYTQLGGNTLFASALHDESLLTNYLASVIGKEPWLGTTFQSSHHRGSIKSVTDYYTPQLAAKVTEWFLEDFIHFHYPVWDGHPETFRYV